MEQEDGEYKQKRQMTSYKIQKKYEVAQTLWLDNSTGMQHQESVERIYFTLKSTKCIKTAKMYTFHKL